MDWTGPQLSNVAHRLVGVLQIEVVALVTMPQVQLSTSPVVAVLDDDVGLPEVGHAGQDRVPDDLPVLLDDDPLVAFQAIEVQVKLLDEVAGQVVPQERRVVVELADLEHLGPALAARPPELVALLVGRLIPAALDVLEDLHPDVVRIDVPL